MQNLLKNKSLFTLFSEIWFNSKVSSYVRDIVRPFLVHNSPEDVQSAFTHSGADGAGRASLGGHAGLLVEGLAALATG